MEDLNMTYSLNATNSSLETFVIDPKEPMDDIVWRPLPRVDVIIVVWACTLFLVYFATIIIAYLKSKPPLSQTWDC